ncbi:MAG: hypothetical protein QNJ46_29015 [Leptolyngbyaceae cyanobacterium MO_188.B28]|nr:hypothetical protein [Leptolyngbyaceae cyanobacterium MO_188.B28]
MRQNRAPDKGCGMDGMYPQNSKVMKANTLLLGCEDNDENNHDNHDDGEDEEIYHFRFKENV